MRETKTKRKRLRNNAAFHADAVSPFFSSLARRAGYAPKARALGAVLGSEYDDSELELTTEVR